jgi:polyhydroxyalkanoate synthesis regulator phasin
MGTKKAGYIEKFLKRADRAIEEGIKKADEILEDAVEFGAIASTQAKKTSKELQKRAMKEKEIMKERGIKKINEGISVAKQITSKAEEDLNALEKLGKLRKQRIITEKEFQEKKKKILSRI